MGEVVERALAAVAPVAFAPGSVMVLAPRIDVLALAPGTLEWTIFPPECVNVRLALVGVEEFVDVREHRHGSASPVVVRSGRTRRGDSHIFRPVLRCYKLR